MQDLSNVLIGHVTKQTTIAATAQQLFGGPNLQYLNAIAIAALQAIADTGVTSIFIMEGTPCKNIRKPYAHLPSIYWMAQR